MFAIEYHYYDEYTCYGYVKTKKQAEKICADFNAWTAQLNALIEHQNNPFNDRASGPVITLSPPFWDEHEFGGKMPQLGKVISSDDLLSWGRFYLGFSEIKPIKLIRKPRKKEEHE